MKIKIQSDFEKARSIKGIIRGRREFVNNFKGKVFPTIICENYYEIIKELATALFLCKGIKFVGEYSHKELIEETAKILNLEDSLLVFLQDLRTRRNGSLYYGEPFEETYLKNNESKIEFVIKKIENILDNELEIKK